MSARAVLLSILLLGSSAFALGREAETPRPPNFKAHDLALLITPHGFEPVWIVAVSETSDMVQYDGKYVIHGEAHSSEFVPTIGTMNGFLVGDVVTKLGDPNLAKSRIDRRTVQRIYANGMALFTDSAEVDVLSEYNLYSRPPQPGFLKQTLKACLVSFGL